MISSFLHLSHYPQFRDPGRLWKEGIAEWVNVKVKQKTFPGLETSVPSPASVSPEEDRRNCAVKRGITMPLPIQVLPTLALPVAFQEFLGAPGASDHQKFHLTTKEGPGQG